jgi:hypothetical protein
MDSILDVRRLQNLNKDVEEGVGAILHHITYIHIYIYIYMLLFPDDEEYQQIKLSNLTLQ